MEIEEGLRIIEIEEQLRSYERQGFKWKRTGTFIDRSQFWTPNYSIDGESIPDLEEHYKHTRLEFGNKEHIDDIKLLNLVDLLFDLETPINLWDSDNLN